MPEKTIPLAQAQKEYEWRDKIIKQLTSEVDTLETQVDELESRVEEATQAAVAAVMRGDSPKMVARNVKQRKVCWGLLWHLCRTLLYSSIYGDTHKQKH